MGPSPIEALRSPLTSPSGEVVTQLIRSFQPGRILEIGADGPILTREFVQRGWTADFLPLPLNGVTRLQAVDLVVFFPGNETSSTTVPALASLTADRMLFAPPPGECGVGGWLDALGEAGLTPNPAFDASFCGPSAILFERGPALSGPLRSSFLEVLRLRRLLAEKEGQIEQLRAGYDALFPAAIPPPRPAADSNGRTASAELAGVEERIAAIEKRIDSLPADSASAFRRLEGRISGNEHLIQKLDSKVEGILTSRIWRTLMQGGAFFLRFTGR